MTDLDLLAELSFLQRHPDSRISDLGDAWDRYLDDRLHTRAEEQAQVRAWRLIDGLLREDHDGSVAAMHEVLTELTTGDDVADLVRAVLRITMDHLGIDHDAREFDHVVVGEHDYSNLSTLTDGDDLVDLALVLVRIAVGVIGRDELRSRARTELGELT